MDHQQTSTNKPNPVLKTNFLFSLFFCYTIHIFAKSLKRELTEDDIYEVLPSYKAAHLGDRLEEEWEKQDRKRHSIFSLLWKCFKGEYLLICSSMVIPLALTVLQPIIFKKFLSCFTPHATPGKHDAVMWGCSLVLVIFLTFWYLMNFQLRLRIFGYKLRAGLTSLIYRRVLKMQKPMEVGKIITLITRDASDIEEATFIITSMIRDFMKFLVLCVLLYVQVGWLCLLFFCIGMIAVFTDLLLAALVRNLKKKTMRRTEDRYQVTKETLGTIKWIKSNNWVDFFFDKVSKIREQEVVFISNMYLLLCVKMTSTDSIFKISWYLMVVASIYFGYQTTAGTLFLVTNSLDIISSTLKITMATGSNELARMLVVFHRIAQFLEQSGGTERLNPMVQSNHLPKVTLLDVKITTASTSSVSLDAGKGVTVVTGSMGTGKTTLLKVIAGEHGEFEGVVKVSGSVSYASQEPWIFPSTVRQNILFGSSYDQKRYLEVLRVCALIEDLNVLPEGDRTVLTSKGGNLSKGQQARINLARAVYKNRDIYLLDDIFSSLDVTVADIIFEECVMKFLRDKIVVLATDKERYLQRLDNVVVLNGGIAKYQPGVVGEDLVDPKMEDRIEVEDETKSLIAVNQERRLYVENKAEGRVKMQTYGSYFRACGVVMLLLVLVLTALIQFANSSLEKMKSKWINLEQTIHDNSTHVAIEKRHQMLYFYPAVLTTVIIVTLCFLKFFYHITKKASQNIHDFVFKKILNATMTFFDTHLLGTIFNRLSEDVLCIDEKLPFSLYMLLKNLAEAVGIIILIGTVSLFFLIPCLIFGLLFGVAGHLYLKAGNALKRLELASRSPLVGHMTATVEGLTTIKIAKTEEILQKEFDRHLDSYTSRSYMYETCEKSFRFAISICSVIFIACVVTYLVVSRTETSVGNVGLVVSQAILFVLIFQMLFGFIVDFENQLTSVERISEYGEEKSEPRDGFFAKNWPSDCKISFENVSLSYKYDDTYAVQDLTFTVNSKEKVAISGRTASGKSSMIAALLRLYKVQGNIFIDGINIATLPLDLLRSKMSVVPQEPIIYSGTVRENIDPTNRVSDEKLWEFLKTVGLSFCKSLDDAVDPNLSVGEKQLLCLCRALVSDNKIVILDEITAYVDRLTEQMIQKVIDVSFGDCTVIMITHDLNQISRCDKVVLLKEGRLLESGKPKELLKKKGGEFYKLYKRRS